MNKQVFVCPECGNKGELEQVVGPNAYFSCRFCDTDWIETSRNTWIDENNVERPLHTDINSNRCVFCGSEIPEGRQVCQSCEKLL